MGDFFKDNPDATGAIISTILVALLTAFFKVDSLIPLIPGCSYVAALLLSKSLMKKENKIKEDDFISKIERVRNTKHAHLEKYTKLSSETKNSEHANDLINLTKKIASEISQLDEMEMNDIIETKKEIDRNKRAISEVSGKISGEIKKQINN